MPPPSFRWGGFIRWAVQPLRSQRLVVASRWSCWQVLETIIRQMAQRCERTNRSRVSRSAARRGKHARDASIEWQVRGGRGALLPTPSLGATQNANPTLPLLFSFSYTYTFTLPLPYPFRTLTRNQPIFYPTLTLGYPCPTLTLYLKSSLPYLHPLISCPKPYPLTITSYPVPCTLEFTLPYSYHLPLTPHLLPFRLPFP